MRRGLGSDDLAAGFNFFICAVHCIALKRNISKKWQNKVSFLKRKKLGWRWQYIFCCKRKCALKFWSVSVHYFAQTYVMFGTKIRTNQIFKITGLQTCCARFAAVPLTFCIILTNTREAKYPKTIGRLGAAPSQNINNRIILNINGRKDLKEGKSKKKQSSPLQDF